MTTAPRYELICVPGRDDEPGVWFCHRAGHSVRCESRTSAAAMVATLNAKESTR